MTETWLRVPESGVGSILAADELLRLLLGNDALAMVEVWTDGAGVVELRRKGKPFSNADGAEMMRQYQTAVAFCCEALRQGDIRSLAVSDGCYFKLPTTYWIAANRLDFVRIGDGMPWPPEMEGRPLAFPESVVTDWLPDARERLADLLDATKPGANDNQATKRQTRPKPKWHPILKDEMEKEDRRITDLMAARPDRLPPIFPDAMKFKMRLHNRRGVPITAMPDTVVRYHYRAIMKELGR